MRRLECTGLHRPWLACEITCNFVRSFTTRVRTCMHMRSEGNRDDKYLATSLNPLLAMLTIHETQACEAM